MAFAIVVSAMAILPFPVLSRSLDDIQQDIDDQEQLLGSTEDALSNAQANLNAAQAELGSVEGEIPKLEAEIAEIEAEIEFNLLQLQLLSEKQTLRELEEEERREQQDRALKNAYLEWRSDSGFGGFLLSKDNSNPLKEERYQSEVMQIEEVSLQELAALITDIKAEISDFEEQTDELEEKNKDLDKKKQEAQARILALQNSVVAGAATVSGLRADVVAIQANLDQLSAEQKALQDYEAWLLGQNSSGGGDLELQPGEFYFTGQGRSLYQGHGVGLSQFGALGAALAGMSASEIVNHYYAQTHIETQSHSITVDGYGTMSADQYAAGIGEVPDKACGSAEQAASNPAKYVEDNPNTVWDCWPAEAIKAQVIAARSYAIYYNNTSGSICTSAACQVYVGGTGKQWAADETSNQVIISDGATHTGQVINALYSSDNHNGYGPANNDTIFSNMSGDGTPYSYLRAVNDAAFTYHASWTDWTYRTNSYEISDFTGLLDYVDSDGDLSYAHGFVNGILNSIGGSVTNLYVDNADRDPSGRVKKVTFVGPGGSSKMAGWLFKSIWNAWVFNEQPSGQVDFIYSQTFFMLQS